MSPGASLLPGRAGPRRRWLELPPALGPPAATTEESPGRPPGAVTDLTRRSAVDTLHALWISTDQRQNVGRHSLEHFAGLSTDVPAYWSAQAEVAIQVERRRLNYHGRHREDGHR